MVFLSQQTAGWKEWQKQHSLICSTMAHMSHLINAFSVKQANKAAWNTNCLDEQYSACSLVFFPCLPSSLYAWLYKVIAFTET